MTTGTEIRDRVLVPLRDADQNFFGDPEILDYMNQAIADLSARQKLIRTVGNAVTASGALAVPADLLQLRWVKNPDGTEVGWMDESTFFDYQATYPDWSADNPIATTYNDKVYLHPSPADGETWTIGYYGLPAEMATISSTFPLRRIWEEKVVRYIRSECWYKLGEPGMGDRERAFYEEGLRPGEAIVDEHVPGRVNFAREPNVFDVHSESIHLGG